MIYGKQYDRLSDEQKIALWKEELEKDIARWHDIKENGCSDPCWPDGVNMDLKRNHIIYDLRQIAELERRPKQVTFIDLLGGFDHVPQDVMSDPRIPPEVPMDYMAKPRRCTYFDVFT